MQRGNGITAHHGADQAGASVPEHGPTSGGPLTGNDWACGKCVLRVLHCCLHIVIWRCLWHTYH